MKLIKASFEIIEQLPGFDGMLKQIEYAGRTCYKSEDKITKGSAKGFADRMIKSGHGGVLEHGTVYLKATATEVREGFMNRNNWYRLIDNSYTKYKEHSGWIYFTTNYRVVVENNCHDLLEYQCEPTEHHPKRIAVKFICDRGVLAEFTRHRVFSFCAESTRYCNYSKDKFGNNLTFIQPCYLDDEKLKLYGPYHTVARDKLPESIFITNLNNAERDYLDLINAGWKPEQARAVLPNALKTELVMTGFVDDWKHFFSLRAREAEATGMHPQADELASPLYKEFISRKYI